MFNYIMTEITPDVAFWGGDSVKYFKGHEDKDEISESLSKVTEQVVSGLLGLQAYITLGNLDTYPQNR